MHVTCSFSFFSFGGKSHPAWRQNHTRELLPSTSSPLSPPLFVLHLTFSLFLFSFGASATPSTAILLFSSSLLEHQHIQNALFLFSFGVSAQQAPGLIKYNIKIRI
uniref:Uncharacterized protein n=1 Tax=Triticum urartu TaxID=4572 RepID=A0A8R7TQN3_TRIUA